jgi:hypothetical protein
MEERRRKRLCYSCDSKWSKGHVCSVQKLFLIEALEEGEEDSVRDIPVRIYGKYIIFSVYSLFG